MKQKLSDDEFYDVCRYVHACKYDLVARKSDFLLISPAVVFVIPSLYIDFMAPQNAVKTKVQIGRLAYLFHFQYDFFLFSHNNYLIS
jgi:hypothetical protein